MKHDLPESYFQKISEVLERYPMVEEAVLYGSRAKGTADQGSDIDLALRGDLDANMARQIEGDLEELPIPQFFDVRAIRSITYQPLLDHIHRVGRVVYHRAASSRPGALDSKVP